MSERTPEEQEHIDIVLKYIRRGDVITHGCCGGSIEEHEFTFYDGRALRGRATPDTVRIGRRTTGSRHGDVAWGGISPLNVSHINRQEVSSLPYVVAFQNRPKR